MKKKCLKIEHIFFLPVGGWVFGEDFLS